MTERPLKFIRVIIAFSVCLCANQGCADDDSNDEDIKIIKNSRHAIIISFDKERISSSEVLWTSDKEAILSIIQRMKKQKHNGVAGIKFMCFNKLLAKDGVQVGLSAHTYDLLKGRFIVLPEPPFKLDLNEIKREKEKKNK